MINRTLDMQSCSTTGLEAMHSEHSPFLTIFSSRGSSFNGGKDLSFFQKLRLWFCELCALHLLICRLRGVWATVRKLWLTPITTITTIKHWDMDNSVRTEFSMMQGQKSRPSICSKHAKNSSLRCPCLLIYFWWASLTYVWQKYHNRQKAASTAHVQQNNLHQSHVIRIWLCIVDENLKFSITLKFASHWMGFPGRIFASKRHETYRQGDMTSESILTEPSSYSVHDYCTQSFFLCTSHPLTHVYTSNRAQIAMLKIELLKEFYQCKEIDYKIMGSVSHHVGPNLCHARDCCLETHASPSLAAMTWLIAHLHDGQSSAISFVDISRVLSLCFTVPDDAPSPRSASSN